MEYFIGFAAGVTVMLVYMTWDNEKTHREWCNLCDRAIDAAEFYKRQLEELESRDEADWWKQN